MIEVIFASLGGILSIIGAIYSIFKALSRSQLEHKFLNNLEEIAFEDNNFDNFSILNDELSDGKKLNDEEWAMYLRIIDTALEKLPKNERSIINQSINQSSELGRLSYATKLLKIINQALIKQHFRNEQPLSSSYLQENSIEQEIVPSVTELKVGYEEVIESKKRVVREEPIRISHYSLSTLGEQV